MYPHTYFGLFPAFRRSNRVFVAMSFDDDFQPRWERVLKPAISGMELADKPLEPHRTDTRRIGDSILTEILGEISNAALIIADITTIGMVKERPVRNGNVMYEVGIAHAVRIPEEVLLFKSDCHEVLFDIANVRVNKYAPDDDPGQAIDDVKNAVNEALREIELKRSLAVEQASRSLDSVCFWGLLVAAVKGGVQQYPTDTMGAALANGPNNMAIARLLEMGLLQAHWREITPELLQTPDESVDTLVRYSVTPFGEAVLEYVGLNMVGSLENAATLVQNLQVPLEND